MTSAYKSIVILTGAGISAESGVRTFRDQNGLWENHRIEDVATPTGFKRNPALVHNFYNARRSQLNDPAVMPNAAHSAIAHLQRAHPAKITLVTQNVDDLHERAGSTDVIHMHGELRKARCLESDLVWEWHTDLSTETLCPCCGSAGNMRPHIVWFDEQPMFMPEIYRALDNCDLFVAIGTSGQVYPAAGFVRQAYLAGADRVEINPVGVENAQFNIRVPLPATMGVVQLVDKLLANLDYTV